MMSRKIFSSKKMVLHGSVLRKGKEPRVRGGEKEKYGKRKKEGDLGDNK